MRTEYKNDRTRALEEAEGSDGRLNVSSRSDNRAYYNSRDEGLCFSVPFHFLSAASGEYAVYWKNTNVDKQLVISSVGINSAVDVRLKMAFVTGTASGGSNVVPTNLNRTASHAASAIAMEGASAATGITGLTEEAVFDCLGVPANSHEEFRLTDRIRLGQNDAVAIEVDNTAGGDVWGVIFGYYE